jgi:hypothetical protein
LLAFLLLAFAHAEASATKNPVKKSRKVFLEVEISQPNVNDCYSGTSVPLQENIENWVNLYPNPNQGFFNIEIKGLFEGEELVIMVFDISGKKVHQFSEKANQERFSKELNISFLPKGVYYVHIQTERKNSVKQLIIL